MKSMTNWGTPPEARWANWVKFTVGGHPIYISPKWDDELGLATWVYEQQLAPLVRDSLESWQTVRQVWLAECGQPLNLPHTEREAEKISKSKQRWHDDVLAEIASGDAREILAWKDDDGTGTPFELLDDDGGDDGEKKKDSKEDASRKQRGRSPVAKKDLTTIAKTIAERGKQHSDKSDEYEPVDDIVRQQYYADQEKRGLSMLQALDEQQKEQIAVKWVQTAAKMISDTVIHRTQQGDKQAQTSAEKKIRENLVDKLVSAIENHPAVSHTTPPLSEREVEEKLSETEFPTEDVPLEIRLDTLALPGLPAPIPSLNVRMYIDEHGLFLGDQKTAEEWEMQIRWMLLRQAEEGLTRDDQGLCADKKYRDVTYRRQQFIRVQEQFIRQMRDQVTVYKILEWAVALDNGAPTLVHQLKIRTVLREGISRANAERIFAEGWLYRLDKKTRSPPRRNQFPKLKESKRKKDILTMQMLEDEDDAQEGQFDARDPADVAIHVNP